MNERNFYYIGIAFFGMVNGLFNQVWLMFALIPMQILAPALLFGASLLLGSGQALITIASCCQTARCRGSGSPAVSEYADVADGEIRRADVDVLVLHVARRSRRGKLDVRIGAVASLPREIPNSCPPPAIGGCAQTELREHR